MLYDVYLFASDTVFGVTPVTWVGFAAWVLTSVLMFLAPMLLINHYLGDRYRLAVSLAVVPLVLLFIMVLQVPTFHDKRFSDCEIRIVKITLDDELLDVGATYCRTRTTLDSEWTDWSLRRIGAEYVTG